MAAPSMEMGVVAESTTTLARGRSVQKPVDLSGAGGGGG
jgi:hypothetical protein